MLPTVPRLTGLGGRTEHPSHQSIPRRNIETFRSNQLLGCSGSCLQKRGLAIFDTTHLAGHPWLHLGVCCEPWTNNQPSWPREPVDWCETHRADPFRPWPRSKDAVAVAIPSAATLDGMMRPEQPRIVAFNEIVDQFSAAGRFVRTEAVIAKAHEQKLIFRGRIEGKRGTSLPVTGRVRRTVRGSIGHKFVKHNRPVDPGARCVAENPPKIALDCIAHALQTPTEVDPLCTLISIDGIWAQCITSTGTATVGGRRAVVRFPRRCVRDHSQPRQAGSHLRHSGR